MQHIIKKYAILITILELTANAIGFIIPQLEGLFEFHLEYNLLLLCRWIMAVVLIVSLAIDLPKMKMTRYWYLLFNLLFMPVLGTMLILLVSYGTMRESPAGIAEKGGQDNPGR